MQNSKKGINSSVLQGLGMGFDIPEEKEIKVESKMLDEDTHYMEIEDFIDETEEELREKQEKALEEFKQGFKGELTAELEEQITNKIKEEFFEELKIERQKFEEEKERLREEELQRVFKESLDLEDEIVKSNLEIVDNESELSEKKSKRKSKKEQKKEESTGTNPIIQNFYGHNGVVIEKKKVSIFKRLMRKLKQLLVLILAIEGAVLLWVTLTSLVNPSLELDIIETFIQINITVFTLIKGVLQDIWGFIEKRYLKK